MPPETIRGLIDWARPRIASLDARLLLQHAVGLRHDELIADPLRKVDARAAEGFRLMVARREAHEPVTRILGAREFYGREFLVTKAVLDPRPDTETLIELALGLTKPNARIIDLGTGSGAIIVTLLAERPDSRGAATDISDDALAVAGGNARRLGVADRLELIRADWFEGLSGAFDLIVSNPPYIVSAGIAELEPDVRNFDPHGALDGGPDGLAAYRRIAGSAAAFLVSGGQVVVEIGAGQEFGVRTVFEGSGFRLLEARRDLGGHVRCLAFALP
jgi:release factor glutamine methyltransferase